MSSFFGVERKFKMYDFVEIDYNGNDYIVAENLDSFKCIITPKEYKYAMINTQYGDGDCCIESLDDSKLFILPKNNIKKVYKKNIDETYSTYFFKIHKKLLKLSTKEKNYDYNKHFFSYRNPYYKHSKNYNDTIFLYFMNILRNQIKEE